MTIRFLLVVVALLSQALAAPSIEEVVKKLEPYIEKSMKEWDTPGVAIAIVKDGKVAYIKGFGVRKVGENDPVDQHTKFHLASVTKNLTAMVIGKLVDQGIVRWDDKVKKHLPEFELHDKQATEEITIRDLMSHRSGLPKFSAESMQFIGMTAAEIIHAIRYIPLESKLGEKYGYQNLFPGVAAVLIERVTGKTFDELLKEFFIDPLSLEDTCVGLKCVAPIKKGFLDGFMSSKGKPNVASLHISKNKKAHPIDMNFRHFTFVGTSGGISSAHDMAKWMIFRLNKAKYEGQQLVSDAAQAEMVKPHSTIPEGKGDRQFPLDRTKGRPSYGIGWFIHDWNGMKVLSHTGALVGTRSLIFVAPEENMGIIVLANMGGMRVSYMPEGIIFKFLDYYTQEKENKDWSSVLLDKFNDIARKIDKHWRLARLKDPKPHYDLKYYTGEFENEIYGRIKIYEKGDKLFLSHKHNGAVPLHHWNGQRFMIWGADMTPSYCATDRGTVWFYGAKSKPVDSLYIGSLLSEGRDPLFKRVG